MKEKALIVVDMQNDFLPGGSLAVEKGDEIIPPINSLIEKFPLVVATQDWHPANHVSFAAVHGKEPGAVIRLNDHQQILWPVHCVQDTYGAELSEKLKTESIQETFKKGIDPKVDSYSAFYDNMRLSETGLKKFLKKKGVKKIYLVGLTLEYCIAYSAIDARELGFDVAVVVDATKAINLMPTDGHEAIEIMVDAGVDILRAEEVF